MSHFRTLRRRQDDLRAALDTRRSSVSQSNAAQLVQVYSGASYPTVTGRVFLAHPVSVAFDETEGAAGTFDVDNSFTLPVVVYGSRVPVVGDRLVAEFVAWEWVAESWRGNQCDPATTSILVTVASSCGGAISGASVTITLGGAPIASGTTDGAGHFSTSITAKGTYSITASKAGFTSGASSVTVSTCGGTTSATLLLPPTTGMITGSGVMMCGSLSPPAFALTAAQAGGGTQSAITDAAGNFSFAAPFNVAGAITFTFSDPSGRFDNHVYTSVGGPNPCTGATITHSDHGAFETPGVCPVLAGGDLDVAAGHLCLGTSGAGCPLPTSTTLHLTDSVYGAVTLQYGGCVGGIYFWEGTKSVTVPGGCVRNGCAPPIAQTCPAATFDIRYTFRPEPTPSLSMHYFADQLPCGAGGGISCAGVGGPGSALAAVIPTFVSLTCPPALSVVFSQALNPGPCDGSNPWDAGATFTLTE